MCGPLGFHSSSSLSADSRSRSRLRTTTLTLSDVEGTLSHVRPVPLENEKDKSKECKCNRWKSRGVSLQGGGMSTLELLQHIVNEPAPGLTSDGRFPKMASSETL
ncbi:hypothetical protein BJY52DRAFT_1248639 [Lactarius psammicola]|nr:hypothetical protein BJY52DRAFT_1248639 [Lactarius psammicola]